SAIKRIFPLCVNHFF
ncbi:hypothetical protein VCHENC02_0102B, partial [Vibrio harveyi]